MENKKLAMEDMAQVAGGTVTELENLVTAGMASKSYAFRTTFAALMHNPISAIAEAYTVQSILKKMGIKSNISVGLLGTGIASEHNTYFDTNAQRSLTQSEVEARLRSA